jgi:hypothetical protein
MHRLPTTWVDGYDPEKSKADWEPVHMHVSLLTCTV